MKVLVIQPKIGMGDMVIYLPYIHAISKKYGVSLSILVKKNTRADQLLAHDKHINEIILLDRSKDKSGSHDGIRGFFKLISQIKSKKFDKVFIFSGSLRYLLISKIAKIKNIAQYPLFRKNDNIVTSAKLFTEHELEQIISTETKIFLKENDIEKAKNKFSKNHKHICLGISASGNTKRWDIKKFIKIAERLDSTFACKFYIAGGRNDQKLINLIMNSKIGLECYSFENLKISDAMPIIKNCDLYIGNDTGWLHISSALGLKCLALFMDSPVSAYGKYSKNISIIIPKGETEVSTTHNTLGKDRVSLEEVYSKVLQLLN
jgi:heptosyltransferase-2|tara:strand:- start:252 stop:1208 length:957 start_codon:yes stop_codon:yes gene_type:complete